MHIGHFLNDLDGRGGIETYVDRLGQGLEARGHTVTYFGLRGNPSSPTRRVVSGIEDLYAQARALDLDVLHLHKSVPVAPPHGLPVIRTVHDNGVTCPSGSRYLKRTGEPCPRIASLPACLFGHYVDGCGSRRPAMVKKNFQRLRDNQRVLPTLPAITVSNYVKEEMLTLNYPAERLHVLHSPAPNGPDSPLPMSTDSPPRLLFLGRLVPEKGIAWLLRAVARLRVDIQVDIAGDGDQRSALEAQIDRLGLREQVTMHGWVEGAALRDLFESARAVVVPSVWHEPAGLVPLEAAAYGRPVVASRVGGLPEYAHPSFSLLVSPNDDEQLAHALQTLCTDPDRAAVLGDAGHEYVRTHHSMSDFLNRHDSLYASLLTSRLKQFETV